MVDMNGNALQGQGKLDEAIACYRRTLDLQSDFVEAHLSLGDALIYKGNVDAAIAEFRAR